MITYLKIEFETQNLKDIEQASIQLTDALKKSFADVGLNDLDDSDSLVINLEQPEELAVVETAVVIGLIGLAKSLVELYKYLKENELEKEKINLEYAKLEFQKLSEVEKQHLRDDFIKVDLPQILQQAKITNIFNIGTSMMVKG